MAEIVLRIHAEGKESHDITAPDDIVTEEFIAELRKGFRLPETDDGGKSIVWEADNKDTGRPLKPKRTLLENGVRTGHNLYLRPAARITPSIPEPPPVIEPPIIPLPPRKRSWLLWAALALIPVAGIAGYLTGYLSTESQAKAALQADQSTAASMKSQYAAMATHVSQLEHERDQLRNEAAERDGAATKQQADFAAQIAAKDKRLALLTAQSNELKADGARKDEQIKKLGLAAQKLPEVQSELAAQQKENAAGQQKLQALQQANASLQQQLQSEKGRQHSGVLTWTGVAKGDTTVSIHGRQANLGALTGSLPGIECAVVALDPERVTILVSPRPENNWNLLAFKVKNGTKAPVRLLWVTK
ncbi:MAG: EsaB/YukD family protein [Bryobacteraceae bacterium]